MAKLTISTSIDHNANNRTHARSIQEARNEAIDQANGLYQSLEGATPPPSQRPQIVGAKVRIIHGNLGTVKSFEVDVEFEVGDLLERGAPTI